MSLNMSPICLFIGENKTKLAIKSTKSEFKLWHMFGKDSKMWTVGFAVGCCQTNFSKSSVATWESLSGNTLLQILLFTSWKFYQPLGKICANSQMKSSKQQGHWMAGNEWKNELTPPPWCNMGRKPNETKALGKQSVYLCQWTMNYPIKRSVPWCYLQALSPGYHLWILNCARVKQSRDLHCIENSWLGGIK